MAHVDLPCDSASVWSKLLNLYKDVAACCDESSLCSTLERIARTAGGGDESAIGGLRAFFKSSEDAPRFFGTTLPFIAETASRLKVELDKEIKRIPFCSAVHRTVSLSRRLVATLLANALLCAFPHEKKGSFSFVQFYKGLSHVEADRRSSQAAKFKCILHYFDRVREIGLAGLNGYITIRRHVAKSLQMKDWLSNADPLCHVEVLSRGSIEDAGSMALQADFAARHLGGGVLRTGRVQEEIRFCINPELLVSVLLVKPMDSNEAVSIQGTERFSRYSGYGRTLKYAGDYQDSNQRDKWGAPLTKIVAMDALNLGRASAKDQYSEEKIGRELTKSYAAFHSPVPDLSLELPLFAATLSKEIIAEALTSHLDSTDRWASNFVSRPIEEATSLDAFADGIANDVIRLAQPESWANHFAGKILSSASDSLRAGYRAVATGNWGCGAFGGDPQLKSMIQWIATSASGRPAMLYYSFDDVRVVELKPLVDGISAAQWNIKRLMKALLDYKRAQKKRPKTTLFDFLQSELQR